MTTTSKDPQSGNTTNGNGSAANTNGNEPIVSDEALAAAERAAATQPPAADPSTTLRDLHPPVHDEPEIPKKKGLGTAAKIAIVVALLGAVIFAAFHLGTRNAGTTVVTKPVPAPIPSTLVSKDMDDSACAFSLAPKGEAFKDGWCKGKTAGAYLFDDDTVAYCSCGKPRGK